MSIPTQSTTSTSERETLFQFLTLYSDYHNHKEQMALSIFGLEGAFFIGLFALGTWPPEVARMGSTSLAIIFVIVWALFHTALRYQLRNRRLAAIMCAACTDALTQGDDIVYEPSSHAYRAPTVVADLVDTFLVPVRGALRASDVDMPSAREGARIRPSTLLSYQYHLANRKNDSAASWTRYALPIEWLTTVGSGLLLGIALHRVLNLPPLPAP
jgi:hypothetical protein